VHFNKNPSVPYWSAGLFKIFSNNSSLRGSGSNDEYFKRLPTIFLIPYQGSSSSTSEGVIKVFDKANKYQETDSKQFPIISVVLLDDGNFRLWSFFCIVSFVF
jgi:hypothetical protein